MNRLIWFTAVLVFSLKGSIAAAHTSGASFIALHARDATTVDALFDFDLRDLNQLAQLDADLNGMLAWGEIEDAETIIADTIFNRIAFAADGACAVRRHDPLSLAQHGDGPFARLAVTLTCSSAESSLSLDYSNWFKFDSGHRALLEYVATDGRVSQILLSQSSPRWRVTESTVARLQRFATEGVHHLITGYDHLAFLGILLLALARRTRSETFAVQSISLALMLRRALVIITAFTFAHSLTLALAASGTLLLPSKPVEVTIALSVFIAALLNLWRGAGSHGWKLAFAFGLVHGLGFAGALVEMAGAGIDLSSLAAFNIGIEAAQIAVAAVAVPAVWWLFRGRRAERIGLPAASVSVAGLVGFWVISRLAT